MRQNLGNELTLYGYSLIMTRIRNEPRKIHTFENVNHHTESPVDSVTDFAEPHSNVLVTANDGERLPAEISEARETAVFPDTEFTFHIGDHNPLPFPDSEFDAVVGFHGNVDLYSRAKTFHEETRVVDANSPILHFAKWVPRSDTADLDELGLFDSEPYTELYGGNNADPDTPTPGMNDVVIGSYWTIHPSQTNLAAFDTNA